MQPVLIQYGHIYITQYMVGGLSHWGAELFVIPSQYLLFSLMFYKQFKIKKKSIHVDVSIRYIWYMPII